MKEPIGLQVIGTAKQIALALDGALVAAGGSLPDWLIFVSLKGSRHGVHPDLAEAVGVDALSLAAHLDRLEANGLVQRPDRLNPEPGLIELTEEGERAFNRLLKEVVAFDRRLRAGVTDEQVATVGDLLARLRLNVSDPPTTADSA
ncbi:MAG: MarR family winged helix-turn-helix transcriptional regulator [Acidimicrobiales bacterium]